MIHIVNISLELGHLKYHSNKDENIDFIYGELGMGEAFQFYL